MNSRFILGLIFVQIGLSSAVAQAPTIQWQKCYGGSLGENAYTINKTSDGGYIIGGAADQQMEMLRGIMEILIIG